MKNTLLSLVPIVLAAVSITLWAGWESADSVRGDGSSTSRDASEESEESGNEELEAPGLRLFPSLGVGLFNEFEIRSLQGHVRFGLHVMESSDAKVKLAYYEVSKAAYDTSQFGSSSPLNASPLNDLNGRSNARTYKWLYEYERRGDGTYALVQSLRLQEDAGGGYTRYLLRQQSIL